MVKPQLLLGYDLMSHVTFRIIQYSQKEIMRLIFYFSTVLYFKALTSYKALKIFSILTLSRTHGNLRLPSYSHIYMASAYDCNQLS